MKFKAERVRYLLVFCSMMTSLFYVIFALANFFYDVGTPPLVTVGEMFLFSIFITLPFLKMVSSKCFIEVQDDIVKLSSIFNRNECFHKESYTALSTYNCYVFSVICFTFKNCKKRFFLIPVGPEVIKLIERTLRRK